MKKIVLLFIFVFSASQAQTDKFWSPFSNIESVIKYKGVERESFPKQFDLYQINLANLKQVLFSNTGNKIITLPNTSGVLEQYEMFEASNFDAELQSRFPEIRAYSGKGLTDKYATLKLSISPQGIQTMVFRTDKPNEFMEKYSQDGSVYAVFNSARNSSKLSWSCGTEDANLIKDLSNKVKAASNTNKFDDKNLRVMRLAQSCTAEYSNYFLATSATNVALVLAAFNATLARCNGVYEKDLALHLNLVAQSTNLIFYDPATDPYSDGATGAAGAWNAELQNTISSTLNGAGSSLATNNGLYDIGHLFGASGGGGNAGCIGCVCRDDTASLSDQNKGSGFTSPGTGGPLGDNFDIDYVVHEVGHQLGGNHTFTHNTEVNGVNREVGSGVTIMGYAGITSYDLAAHSIDTYHAASIQQIQANLITKTCPVTTNITANNATPVVNAGLDYTIPKSTSFILTGSATDANPNDALTYSWEQNDDAGSGQRGASSVASVGKLTGPNWRSNAPTASPSRYMPTIASVIANSQTTLGTGNDGINVEALSSVARTLNFRLTVRDNAPYSSVVPLKVAQTSFDDMVVTVNATAGPFVVNSPNTALSWPVGSSQNVSWNVAGTTANGVNTAAVDIFLSIDGGFTYPITLATNVPNNGSATIVVPNNVGTTNRVMVKGNQHIFFDISNVNFTIAAATNSFSVAASGPSTLNLCSAPTTAVYTISYSALGGFSGTTTFSATGNPAGSTVVFSPATMSSTSGPVTMTVNGLTTAPNGTYNIVASATSGASTQTVPFILNIGVPNVVLSTPANNANTQNTTLTLSWAPIAVATSYDVQVSTSATFATIFSSGNVTTTSYNVTGLAQGTLYYWRVLAKNATCSGVYGQPFNFTTGICNFANATPGLAIPDGTGADISGGAATNIINIPTTGTVNNMKVKFNTNHTWTGDLVIKVIHPDNTAVVLWNRNCDTARASGMNVTFQDGSPAIVCGSPTTGTFAPFSALSVLNGKPTAGNWTISAEDLYNVDTGNIVSWGVDFGCVALANQNFNIDDAFSVFPNPNQGSFTVKYNSNSGNQISIDVYDMRGRNIYSNKYQNDGLFYQNVNLFNIQAGMYMVTVKDGEKQGVKKIIVE
jgi:subtilisin-like proprotein convertase family protein